MKKNILLLHGAIGSAAQWDPFLNLPQTYFNFLTLNFRGHGGLALPDAPFSMHDFVQDVLHFLDQQQIESIDIVGYSMGGYVAAMLAASHPQRVRSIFTLATKWHWDEATAERETKLLQPDKIEAKLPAFAAVLAERHQPADWKGVLNKTAEMLRAMGRNNPLTTDILGQLNLPVRIALGDKDTMVTLEETLSVYRCLPNASCLVLPQTPHPIEKVNASRLLYEWTDFFMQP